MMIKESKHLVTTFPYGTNVFKVCETEMLLKNKLIDPDEDIETEDIHISKTEGIETEDIDISKTEDVDVSKNAYAEISKIEDIDISKIEDIDNTKTKDKDEAIDKGRNTLIQMFRYSKRSRNKKGNWKKRQIVSVFWDVGHVSELCEKWICYDSNYAYARFEELHTCSGEVLFTREHKGSISKDESNTYIDTDELQMFKDFSTKDKTKTKTKTKTKINKRIDTMNKSNNLLAKLKAEVTKKIELVYELMCELQDE